MTDETTTQEIIDEAPDDHPTAAEKIEWLDSSRERAQRLVDGYVEVPWPSTSRQIAIISGMCVGMAGALTAWSLLSDPAGGGLLVVAVVFVIAAVALAHYAKFVHTHFETGEEPRYVENDG